MFRRIAIRSAVRASKIRAVGIAVDCAAVVPAWSTPALVGVEGVEQVEVDGQL
jgi:hypothetical protein